MFFLHNYKIFDIITMLIHKSQSQLPVNRLYLHQVICDTPLTSVFNTFTVRNQRALYIFNKIKKPSFFFKQVNLGTKNSEFYADSQSKDKFVKEQTKKLLSNYFLLVLTFCWCTFVFGFGINVKFCVFCVLRLTYLRRKRFSALF